MSFVLDSSVALAWIYSEETTAPISNLLTRLEQSDAWVPQLWKLEVANVLGIGVRKGRHDAAFRDRVLADLAILPIRVDPETNQHAWSVTVRLADQHKLTVYDAAYLELAQRRRLPLATLDTELRSAASAEDIDLLGK
jgi:predicted nucleic acid-binding protein